MDTSALAKLLITEHESDVLTSWLAELPPPDAGLVSSVVARVELVRTVARRDDPDLPDQARYLLQAVGSLELTWAIVDRAARLTPPSLRSLDAIHVASAVGLRDQISAFVSYDKRLLDAARAEGLTVVSPGAE